MSKGSVLITGANRGIGLELVQRFLSKKGPGGSPVIATCRNPDEAKDLQALASAHANCHVVALEMTDFETFKPFADKVAGILEKSGSVGLNLLINNAGVLAKQGILDLTEEAMIDSYRVNTIAPLFLTRALLPLLRKAAQSSDLGQGAMTSNRACVIQMSTSVASMAENASGGMYPYRCSKAALNMSMVNLALDLKPAGILVMSMHPGWVKSEMGGQNAPLTTEECVVTMLETIDQLGSKDHGKFLRYNNTEIPW